MQGQVEAGQAECEEMRTRATTMGDMVSSTDCVCV